MVTTHHPLCQIWLFALAHLIRAQPLAESSEKDDDDEVRFAAAACKIDDMQETRSDV